MEMNIKITVFWTRRHVA